MKGGSGGGDTKPAVSNGSPAPAKAAIKVGLFYYTRFMIHMILFHFDEEFF